MTHRRIWASLDDYAMPADGRGLVGRSMANAYFLRAMLEHSSFDEFHFFLANGAHQRFFVEAHGALIDRLGRQVQLYNRVDLAEKLVTENYHVLHQGDHVHRYNALCRVRNRLGVPVPVTARIHSISYGEYMGKYLEMAATGATAADAIFCSSQSGRQVMERCFDRVAACCGRRPAPALPVLPLGVGWEGPSMPKNEARAQCGLAAGEVIALAFGRFSDMDKMDLFPLLQAMRRVVEPGRPWRLVLAGAVNAPDYLRMVELWGRAQGVAAHLFFVTDPDEDAKIRLYSAADFFVSVADNPQETFGLTLVEAMAAGLPLLVADLDGYRETATPDCGILVPTLWDELDGLSLVHPAMDEATFHRYVAQCFCVDIEALAAGLARLFGDADVRQSMGKAARRRFECHYSHRAIIGAMEATWRELSQAFVPAPPVDPLNMEMFSSFSHYASGRLDDDDSVAASALASELAAAGISYPLLAGMNEVIDRDSCDILLKHATAPVRVAQLASFFPPAAAWRFRYHVLWMLKHGLLERTCAADQSSAPVARRKA